MSEKVLTALGALITAGGLTFVVYAVWHAKQEDPREEESGRNLNFLRATGEKPAGTEFDKDGYLISQT